MAAFTVRAAAAWAALAAGKDLSGRPLQGQAETYGPRRVSLSSPAAGMTPARIAGLLQAAEDGYPRGFAELWEHIEDRDTQIVSVLGTRKRSVANLSWSIVPASPKAADRRIAEWCEEAVRGIENLEDAAIDLLSAIALGYAASEIEWERRQDRLAPAVLHYRPQRWLRPDPADPYQLRLLSSQDSVTGAPLEPDRWVTHFARAKAGFPVKAGLGRVLCWWWLFKSFAVKDWVSYLELFGVPLRIGKYPAGAQAADIDALDLALRQLGVDASAVIPADMSVEFPGDSTARAGGATFEPLLVHANREIAKATLGQTLTTEEGQRGTQALGMVHNDVRQDLVISDAIQLARTWRRGLLEPMVRLNFGPSAGVPRWVYDAEPAPDALAEATAQEARGRVFRAAAELGLGVPASQVYDELAIREPAAGEALIELPTPAPAFPFRSTPERAPSARSTRGLGGGPCPRCGTRHALTDRPLPPIWAQYAQVVPQYLEPLLEAWRAIVATLQGPLAAGDLDAGAVAGLSEVDLAVYVDALSAATLSAHLLGQAHVAAGDQPVTVPEASPLVDPVSWAALIGGATDQLADLVDLHRRRATETAQNAALAATQAIVETAAGDTERPRVEAVQAAAEQQAGSPQRTSSVLEAAGTTDYSRGRATQQERESQRRPYYRYRTMRDAAVRERHKAMEGRVWPADHEIWQTWRPPNGWGCRCWLEAFSQLEVDEAGWKIESELPRAGDRPLTPDGGWARDHLREEHEYDWSAYPADWRRAVGAP